MFKNPINAGLSFALCAYGLWGLAPIFFKWLDHVPATEIIAHRIVWSLLLLLAILAITGKLGALKKLLPKIRWLFVSAFLVSGNWLIFVWAVANEKISETSLGYFINPLVSVLLARLFLGEKLGPLQLISFAFAIAGVIVRLINYGELPWVALALATSFGFYGLVRKKINAPAIAGLAIETALLAPIALGYLIWLSLNHQLVFSLSSLDAHSLTSNGLLILSGLVTTLPLLCFAAAVTRLSLISMGMMQYIAPSMSLVIAVFMYGEPFSLIDGLSFALIWFGLIIFSVEAYMRNRQYKNILEENKKGDLP